MAATLLFTLLATRLWSGRSLHRLVYERVLSVDRAFPGDEVVLGLRLANDKLLPLPWVEVDDRVPRTLEPEPIEGGPEGSRERGHLAGAGIPRAGETPALPAPLTRAGRVPALQAQGTEPGRIRLGTSVSWKERVTWVYRLTCGRRGIYLLGPGVVTSGDPFGFFPRSRRVGGACRLVVYPRLIPLEALGLPPGFPLGERKPERWIFEDPTRTVGVREYRREDSLRRIHWKATARRQELQVRIHEPTTTLETAVFLAVDTFGQGMGDGGCGLETAPNAQFPIPNPHPPSPNPQFETAVSVAASVAHRLIGQQHPVGLYTNGGAEGTESPVELPPGSSQERLMGILEALAGVEAVPGTPIATLLAEAAPRLPWGSNVVVVAGRLPEPLLLALEDLRRTGRRPVVLLTGDSPAPEPAQGVAVHRVLSAEDWGLRTGD